MSYGLKKSEWVDILSTIYDKLESIEAKSFKETKEDFEVMMLDMYGTELSTGDRDYVLEMFGDQLGLEDKE